MRVLYPTIVILLSLIACGLATPTPTATPDSSQFYNQGLEYLNNSQYQLAIEQFNKAAELNPDDSNIYANRGLAHHWLGAYGEASADYGRALELDPDNYLTYYNRGVSFGDRGQHERAVADYRRAIERNPTDPLSHNNLAWGLAYHLDINYEEALEYALRSVELSPEDYNLDTLALVYYKLERYEEALEYYNRALALNSSQLDSLKGRGDVYLALGSEEAAVKDYEIYLALAPESLERAEVEAKLEMLRAR